MIFIKKYIMPTSVMRTPFHERITLPGCPTVDLNHDGLPEYVSATNPDSLIFQDKTGH